MTGKTCFMIFDTEAGPCGIAWTAEGVVRFQLPGDDAATTRRRLLRRLPEPDDAEERRDPPPEIVATIAAAQRYFAGEKVDFQAVPLDLSGESDAFRAIYDAARRLGWGDTTTYGALAREIGAGPEAARDVGQACHRVLAAGGRIGGFSAPGGSASKAKMLALEGISLAPPPQAQQSFGF
jgi:methylated-DNA-[protein]-cysteine S-methyltransferase